MNKASVGGASVAVRDTQSHRWLVAGAERDVRGTIRLDAARAAPKLQVLALQAIALSLHAHVAVEFERAEVAIELDALGFEFDAILTGFVRRLRGLQRDRPARPKQARNERKRRTTKRHVQGLRGSFATLALCRLLGDKSTYK